MTAAAPSGVVTFLFTDIEGSTRRWEKDADGMRVALAAHDEVLRSARVCGFARYRAASSA
jgi:class 3 adenylate cyclase